MICIAPVVKITVTPLFAFLPRPWYSALFELAVCAVALFLIVIVCKSSKKGAPIWGRAGMTMNLLAIAVGGTAGALVSFAIFTMPSHWNSTYFWDLWEDNLRWDWWLRDRIADALLCSPVGMLTSVLVVEFAWRLFRQSAVPADAKEPTDSSNESRPAR
jgi:hypothetical protein